MNHDTRSIVNHGAIVIAASAIAIIGLRKAIAYIKGESTEFYAPPSSLTSLFGFRETDVLLPSSSLWMVDQKVLSRDTMTKRECVARHALVSNVRYDVVLWIRPGSCYIGESTISFQWNRSLSSSFDEILPDCFLNFAGGVIENIWINGIPIGRDGRPDISGPFQIGRRSDTVKWKSHRIVIGSQLLVPDSINEVVIRYFSEYDRGSVGLCQIAEQSQYAGSADAVEEYVFSGSDGFEAHRIFPCFDQPDIKDMEIQYYSYGIYLTQAHWRFRFAVPPQNLVVSPGVNPTDGGRHPSRLHSIFKDDFIWYQTVNALCHGKLLDADLLPFIGRNDTNLHQRSPIKSSPSFTVDTNIASSRLSTHEDLPPHFIDMLGFPSSHPSRLLSRLLIARGNRAIASGTSALEFLKRKKTKQGAESDRAPTALHQPSVHEEGPESGLLQSIPRTHNRITEFQTEKPCAPCDLTFAIGPFHFIEHFILRQSNVSNGLRLPVTLFYRRGSKKSFNPEIVFSIIENGFNYFENYLDQPFPYSKLDFVYLPETQLVGATRRDPFLSHGPGIVIIPESSLYFTADAPTEIAVRCAIGILQSIILCWVARNITIDWWEEAWWSRSIALYLVFDAIGKPPLSRILATVVSASGNNSAQPVDELSDLIFHTVVKRLSYNEDSNIFVSQPPCCSIPSINQLLPVAQLNRKKGAGILRQMESLVGPEVLRHCIISFITTTEYHQSGIRIKDFFSSVAAACRSPNIKQPSYPQTYSLRNFNHELALIGGRELLNTSLWIPSWLGRSCLNTLHAVWSASSSGLISAFEIRQTAPTKTSQPYRPRRVRLDLILRRFDVRPPITLLPSQRNELLRRLEPIDEELPQNTEDSHSEISSLEEDDDSVLYHIESYLIDLIGPITSINRFIGKPSPLAVLINTDDNDYARVWLDGSTLLFIESQLYTLKSPLTRLIVWSSLWDSMEDNELCSMRFLEIFEKQAPLEENVMVLSQAVIFITNTLRLFIPDEIYLEGCVKIRTAAIDGERRQRSPEMKALWQWLLATVSVDGPSISMLLERMDREDPYLTKSAGEKAREFQWSIRGGYWRKDIKKKKGPRLKGYEITPALEGKDIHATSRSSETPLSPNTRWIVLENLWALDPPIHEPERSWWVAEREKRLSAEMDKDLNLVRVQNNALKCYAANPEESSMEQCWNRFMSVSAMTYKEVISLMNSFNRRRFTELDLTNKQSQENQRPTWSLHGFYSSATMKKIVQDRWMKLELEHFQHEAAQRNESSEMPRETSSTFDRKSLNPVQLRDIIQRYDHRFVRDVKELFFSIDPVLAKKVWNALSWAASELLAVGPLHRPSIVLRDSLEVALNACGNTSSREVQELRRSIGASLQTIDKIRESRRHCMAMMQIKD